MKRGMFSYRPLALLMLKRSITINGLAEKLGVTKATVTREFDEENILIKTDTLEKLCEALQCNIGDILEWREKGVLGIGVVPVDWEKLKLAIKDKGYSYRKLSLAAGLSPATISNSIQPNIQGMSVFNLLKICKLLDLDVYEVVK